MSAEQPDDATRELLGRFLRERRGRIPVEQAGLPAHRGRRSATLTQEDLARLTGYSTRTISALEQGSEHRPTRELLDALTAALRLTGDERRTLWQLAAQLPPPEDDYATALDPSLARVVEALDPHPAYVTDAVYNVQAHNRAFARWVCDFAALPVAERNLALWLFCSPHARHILARWDPDVPRLVARIRAVHTRLPHNRQLAALIEQLCDRSPYFRREWAATTDVTVYPTSVTIWFRAPGHTDPDQVDDERYHVPLTMSTLTPMTPDDHHRLVAFLLPETAMRPAPAPGADADADGAPQACAACARELPDDPGPGIRPV